MKEYFKSKGFSIRLLVSGIITIIATIIFAWFINEQTADTIVGAQRVLQMVMMSGVMVFSMAVTALFSTFYWKVTVYMIVNGCGWAIRIITDYLMALSLALSGIIFVPLSIIVGAAILVVCIVLAIGPYIAIPMGFMYLIAHYVPSEGVMTCVIYGFIMLAGIAYVVIVHFIIPINNLRRIANEERDSKVLMI